MLFCASDCGDGLKPHIVAMFRCPQTLGHKMQVIKGSSMYFFYYSNGGAFSLETRFRKYIGILII